MSNKHSLPHHLIHAMEEVGIVMSYVHDEIIHERGDAKPGLSIVKQGRVKVGNYGKEGKYCLTRVLDIGETFGEFTLFADLPRTHCAEAVGDTHVIQVSREQFSLLSIQQPDLNTVLLSTLAIKLHDSLELLDDIRRLPLQVRAAKTLLTLTNQTSSSLSITQNELADVLGVTVLSVHKALKSLSALGFVRLGYGSIAITEIEALTHWVSQQSSLNII